MSNKTTIEKPTPEMNQKSLDEQVAKLQARKAEVERKREERLKNEEAMRALLQKEIENVGPEVEAQLAKLRSPAAKELAKWTWDNITLPNIIDSRLPERYQYKIEDDEWLQPQQKKVFDMCRKFFTRIGAIVSLVGNRGVGKTVIAAQLIIERAENEQLNPWERNPPYRKLADLLARFKPLYADFGSIDTESLIASRNNYCRLPFVVIDEIHDCEDQKMADRILTDILDRRYAAMVDTLLISNKKTEDFQRDTGESILSRINEHGAMIPCTWPSWRDGEWREHARTGGSK